MTTTVTGLKLLPEHEGVDIELAPQRGQHWYKVRGYDGLFPSVTTVLKIIDKSGPLVGWAKNVMAEKVRTELLDNPYPERGAEWPAWADGIVDRAKARPDQVRDKAAAQGTSAHGLIADFLQGGNPLVPDDLGPAVRGALCFIADYELEVAATELAIWHPVNLYAGTVDFVGRDREGRLVVADWKRSKGIYAEHGYQVAAYANAIEALTGERVIAAYVVRLPRTETEGVRYDHRQVADVHGAFETYLAAQELWRGVKQGAVWQ